jgi:hypothetical protein
MELIKQNGRLKTKELKKQNQKWKKEKQKFKKTTLERRNKQKFRPKSKGKERINK